MAELGTYPLAIDLVHGEHNLGTVTIALPVTYGEPWVGEDGKQYVSIEPALDEGTIRKALIAALEED